MESNCPERIEHVFVIKGKFFLQLLWQPFYFIDFSLAPALFPVCYNLVKHIFDEKTRKKIFVFGGESLLPS